MTPYERHQRLLANPPPPLTNPSRVCHCGKPAFRLASGIGYECFDCYKLDHKLSATDKRGIHGGNGYAPTEQAEYSRREHRRKFGKYGELVYTVFGKARLRLQQ